MNALASAPRPSRTPRAIVSFGDWRLATKVVALCVAVSVVLTAGLTTLGYVQASQGLKDQAEAALGSDALLVAGAVDEWNVKRVSDLQVLAGQQAIRRVAEAGSAATAAEVAAAEDALKSLDDVARDVDSVGILDAGGSFLASSNPKDMGSNVKQRDYFTEAMKGQTFISGVSISTITNAPSIFHSVPIKGKDGKVLGVIRSRAALDAVQQQVEAARNRVGEGSQGVLMDENGLVIASSVDPTWLLRPIVALKSDTSEALTKDKRWGNNPAPDPLGQTDLAQAIGSRTRLIFTWSTGGTEYHALVAPLTQTRWTYVAALPNVTFEAAARTFLRNAVLAAVVGLVLAAVVAVLVARPIAGALRQVAQAAAGLAEGDLDQVVHVNSRDEVGEMARAFQSMIDYQQQMARVAHSVAQGDFTHDVRPKSERDVLGKAFQTMNAHLRDLVGQVRGAAISLAETSSSLGTDSTETALAATQVSDGVQHVARGFQATLENAQTTKSAVVQLTQAIDGIARGAGDQASQVQAATSTSTQMADGVEDVARKASEVASVTERTRKAAEHGGKAVEETVAGMAEIRDVVAAASERVSQLGSLGEKIGAVVQTIDDIAEQTNLLALNAAIEAARAGEHGKGFAVVADEVRKLAERSGRETKQIAELILQVQDGTREAVKAMEQGSSKVEAGSAKADQAGQALAEIVEAARSAVEQVGGIAAAAQEMAAGARSVVDAMQSISAVVEENSAATQEMSAQAEQVRGSIDDIARTSENQSAAIEEISAGAEEMSAQVEGMGNQVRELASMADKLKALVVRFKVDGAEASDGVASAAELRRAA